MAKLIRTVLAAAILPIAGLLCSFGHGTTASARLKCDRYINLKKIPEPSDIVYDKQTGTCYIVSDHGKLFECDKEGKILRKAAEEGMDFEGVEVTDSFVYVSDEMPRKVYQYRKADLSLINKYSVSWQGPLNKAFESITYNETKHCFVMVSQQPVAIVEFDAQMKQLDKHSFHGARDISAARWHNGYLYLMSALDECIIKCDPNTYEPLQRFYTNVYNGEGLAFDDHDNVYVTSDDLQRLYFFQSLPAIK